MQIVLFSPRKFLFPFLLLYAVLLSANTFAQNKNRSSSAQDTLIQTAREIMATARYCSLITVDSSGQPQARIMEPFLPDEKMIVWFGTNPKSRKVRQIRNDPRVTLFYFDKPGLGYVSIIGSAKLINGPAAKKRYWKEQWKGFYPDRDTDYLLISVVPQKMEIVSIKHHIFSKQKSWAAPTVFFNHDKAGK